MFLSRWLYKLQSARLFATSMIVCVCVSLLSFSLRFPLPLDWQIDLSDWANYHVTAGVVYNIICITHFFAVLDSVDLFPRKSRLFSLCALELKLAGKVSSAQLVQFLLAPSHLPFHSSHSLRYKSNSKRHSYTKRVYSINLDVANTQKNPPLHHFSHRSKCVAHEIGKSLSEIAICDCFDFQTLKYTGQFIRLESIGHFGLATKENWLAMRNARKRENAANRTNTEHRIICHIRQNGDCQEICGTRDAERTN